MATERTKRCLYEVLGVSRDCSVDEIRSAYRKLALQLHPDKVAAASGGVVSESATAAFQELLHAYEVLSDPRERAYYDSHRSQILFSEPDMSGRNNSSFDLDLFSFLSPSAFSGYSDSGRGFYKVYRDAFEKINAQELWFATGMGLGSDAVQPAPLMGNLESPYSQVSAFYNYWLSFCTVLDFGWVDMYDAAAGCGRRDRRKMEEENKKLRRKAKREYNETVRGLAAFVKKRDKRVMDMAVKKKAEEEKKRAEEKEKKKEEERKKLERAMLYEEPEWAKVDNMDEEDARKDDDDFGHEGEDNINRRKELYCVVCSKKFKSEKQWKNHEQSKKHKDKVAEFRNSLVDEEEEDGQEHQEIPMDDVNNMIGDAPDVSFDGANDGNVDKLCDQFEGLLDAEEETDDAVASNAESDSGFDYDEDAMILEAMISGKKGGSSHQCGLAPVSDTQVHVDSEEEGPMQYDASRKGGKNRACRKEGRGKTDKDMQKQESVDTMKGESASHSSNDPLQEMQSSHSFEADRRNNEHGHVSGKNQKMKQQKFDGRIVAKESHEPASKKPAKGKKQKVGPKAPNNSCDTCGESFETSPHRLQKRGLNGTRRKKKS